MNVSRNFLLMGALYLIVGICMGMYMGASQDFSLTPVHAHINLLGFTLMTVFGLVYHVFPRMNASRLSTIHFWLHQIGVLVALTSLFLILSGNMEGEKIGPFMFVFEIAILVGVILFGWNLLQNGRAQ